MKSIEGIALDPDYLGSSFGNLFGFDLATLPFILCLSIFKCKMHILNPPSKIVRRIK
jgi:hypothetical protein